MRLAASQRLWSAADEPHALTQVRALGIEGIAPLASRLWDEGEPLESGLRAARIWAARLRQEGLLVPALLDPADGRHGALSGPRAPALFARLRGAFEIAAALGAHSVILGAPALRRASWGPGEVEDLIERFFHLAHFAGDLGLVLGIKPVARLAGARFWTHAQEVYDFCAFVGHPALRVALDAGGLVNDPAPRAALAAYSGSSPVFLASEPFGGPVSPRPDGHHEACAADLARLAQMRRAPDWLVWEGDCLDERNCVPALIRQAAVLRQVYGPALCAPLRQD